MNNEQILSIESSLRFEAYNISSNINGSTFSRLANAKKTTTQNLPLPDYKVYPRYQDWLVGVSSQALFHQNHYRKCAHARTVQTQFTTIQ